MNKEAMNKRIDQVLENMDATELEERIAPVDCAKKPNHPDCQMQPMYGVEPPVALYAAMAEE